MSAGATIRPVPKIERLEHWLLSQPVQAEHDMKHSFGPGIYLREILMLKHTLLIGHEHKLEHFNMVLSGKALVVMDGKEQLIEGPCYFKSAPGVRKVLYILEDMRWVTIHPNPDDERDLAKLEDRQIRRSETFTDFVKTEEFRRRAEQYLPRRLEIA